MTAIQRLAWQVTSRVQGFPGVHRQIDRFGNLSDDEARSALGELLLTQLRYFGSRADALPEWKEAAAVRTVNDVWTLWPHLPILTKDDLRDRFHPSKLEADLGIRGVRSSTGGSTGEPTPFLHTPEMRRATTAATLYTRLRFGWRFGMPTVSVWGSERDIGRQRNRRRRLVSWLRNDHLIDGYRMSAETTSRCLDFVRRHPGGVTIAGFTSMLELVARETIERGKEPPAGRVVAAWNGGEVLRSEQSDVFRQAFGVPILNSYGGRELSAMAYQPPEHDWLRVLRPLLMVEIVDDVGAPVAPGEMGRLIWTSTVCRGTPFLRYDIGDLGRTAPGLTGDSGISGLTSVDGRVAEILELPNGRRIHTMYWNHLMKDFPEVEQFQVAMIGGATLELRFRGGGMGTDREAQLLGTIRSFAGDIPLGVQWMAELPRTPQGKRLQVVHESRSET